MKHQFALAIASAALLALPAFAAKPKFYAYEVKPGGMPVFTTTALNESGQVIGTVLQDNGTGVTAFITGPNGQGITLIPAPEPDQGSIPYAVNDNGQVTGNVYGPLGGYAFVTDANGTNPRKLSIPAPDCMGYGITNGGTILAQCRNNKYGQSYFFAYADGRPSVEILPGHYIASLGMNNAEQLIGQISIDNVMTPIITGPQASGYRVIDAPPGVTLQMAAFNDSGVVVGSAALNNTYQPFVTKAQGVDVQLKENLGGDSGIAVTVDANGRYAGSSQRTTNRKTARAFVALTNGPIVDLNVLVVNLEKTNALTSVKDMNSHGKYLATSENYTYYLVCQTVDCE